MGKNRRHKRRRGGTIVMPDPNQKRGVKPSVSSRHHIVPSSRGGSSNPDNIIYIDDRFHKMLHDVFGNLKPDEYLSYINNNLLGVCFKIIGTIAKHMGISISNIDADG